MANAKSNAMISNPPSMCQLKISLIVMIPSFYYFI